ncbi:MAG: ADP-forming succinate--CoA ligase subunit beta [Puniceicoccales bacterium]|nr:ADP-forming succinate--CoA ligase subunit beta [Puniceicoccales bacterium]
MEVHEFQAKELLEAQGVPVGRRVVARTEEEIGPALDRLGRDLAGYVVKAQVHSGGRSRGHFPGGSAGGGVRCAATACEAEKLARAMLGRRLATAQSGEAGKPVAAVLVEEAVPVAQEFYLALLLDRRAQLPLLLASNRGGVAVEESVQEHGILREWIRASTGPCQFQLRRMALALGLAEEQREEFCSIARAMGRLFWEKDANLVEINPLALTTEGRFRALDAKVVFDDSGLFRQDAIRALRDPSQGDWREERAERLGLSYVALGGTVACLTNGAGLAMATMDLLQAAGIRPANFLDLGDSAGVESVTEAFRLILDGDGVRCLLINVFGGTMRGDLVAEGVLRALAGKKLSLPLLLRLEGPAAELGRAMLREHIPGVKIVEDLNGLEEAIRQGI